MSGEPVSGRDGVNDLAERDAVVHELLEGPFGVRLALHCLDRDEVQQAAFTYYLSIAIGNSTIGTRYATGFGRQQHYLSSSPCFGGMQSIP